MGVRLIRDLEDLRTALNGSVKVLLLILGRSLVIQDIFSCIFHAVCGGFQSLIKITQRLTVVAKPQISNSSSPVSRNLVLHICNGGIKACDGVITPLPLSSRIS